MVSELSDKSALLAQLKIDKNKVDKEEVDKNNLEKQKQKLWVLAVVAVVSAVLSALATYIILQPNNDDVPVLHDTSENSSTTTVNISRDSIDDSHSDDDNTAPLTYTNTVLDASGYITARRVATVSAETMGLIDSVEVEEGMAVEGEQILATLDDAVARVSFHLAEAQVGVQKNLLKSLEIEFNEAKRVYERIVNIENTNYRSEAELTEAKALMDRSAASIAATHGDIQVAYLQVEQAQEFLDNHTIRAPFAGVVTEKNAQPGEIVAPSSAGGGFTRTGICTIVDMDSLEIEVDVNEAFIGRVYAGQQVVANLDAYSDWDIPASVIAIIPTADRAKATVRVRIKLELSDKRILPDMGVKVAFLK